MDSGTTRRRFLTGAAVAAGTAALAGCPAAFPDRSPQNDSLEVNPRNMTFEGPDDRSDADRFVRQYTGPITPFQYLQFNPYNPRQRFGVRHHFDPLAVYDRVAGEFVPALAAEWDVRDESILLTLDDRYVWSNGDPVTAADVARHLWILRFAVVAPATYLDDWTVVDDRTIEVRTNAPDRSSRLLLYRLLRTRPAAPAAQWADVVERLRAAEVDSQAYDEALSDVVKRRIGTDAVVGNGPYLVDSVSPGESRVTFTRNDDHPLADRNPVSTYVETKFPQDRRAKNVEVQAIGDGRVDHLTVALSETAVRSMPAGLLRAVVPTLRGTALYFNRGRAPFEDHRVRRAAGLAVQTAQAALADAALVAPPATATGIPNRHVAANWTGADRLRSYARDGGLEAAAELVRAAGYEQSGGTWTDESGAPVSLVATTPNNAPYNPMGPVLSALDEFGFDAELTVPQPNSADQTWSDIWGAGAFDVAGLPVGAPVPDPWYYYDAHFAGGRAKTAGIGGTYEVPATDGDIDGATETVDATALTAELGRTEDSARARDLAGRLAWTVNSRLPCRSLVVRARHEWYDARQWALPDVADPFDPPAPYVAFDDVQLLARGYVEPN